MNNREQLIKILKSEITIDDLPPFRIAPAGSYEWNKVIADRILESLAKCEECDGDGCFGSKSGGYTNCDHCSGTGIIVKEVK